MTDERDCLDYLRDILEAIDNALAFVAGMDFAAFREDQKTIYAAVRSLEIIGEAARTNPVRPSRQTRGRSLALYGGNAGQSHPWIFCGPLGAHLGNYPGRPPRPTRSVEQDYSGVGTEPEVVAVSLSDLLRAGLTSPATHPAVSGPVQAGEAKGTTDNVLVDSTEVASRIALTQPVEEFRGCHTTGSLRRPPSRELTH